MKLLVLFLALAGCLTPPDPLVTMSRVELERIVSPQTTCGTLCNPGDDQFCRDECGPAICSQARCDNCGGICVYLIAIP